MIKQIFLCFFLLLLVASLAFAGEPAYVVRLTGAALVEEPEVVARRLAGTYGGTVESPTAEAKRLPKKAQEEAMRQIRDIASKVGLEM